MSDFPSTLSLEKFKDYAQDRGLDMRYVQLLHNLLYPSEDYAVGYDELVSSLSDMVSAVREHSATVDELASVRSQLASTNSQLASVRSQLASTNSQQSRIKQLQNELQPILTSVLQGAEVDMHIARYSAGRSAEAQDLFLSKAGNIRSVISIQAVIRSILDEGQATDNLPLQSPTS
jgi:hypothetical protein